MEPFSQLDTPQCSPLLDLPAHQVSVVSLEKSDSQPLRKSHSCMANEQHYLKRLPLDFEMVIQVNMLICQLDGISAADQKRLQSMSLELVIKMLKKDREDISVNHESILANQENFMRFVIYQMNANDSDITAKLLLFLNVITLKQVWQPGDVSFIKQESSKVNQTILIINNL